MFKLCDRISGSMKLSPKVRKSTITTDTSGYIAGNTKVQSRWLPRSLYSITGTEVSNEYVGSDIMEEFNLKLVP